MHRTHTNLRTVRLSFKLAIQRALAVLYERRAEIDDLISCLESQARFRKNSERVTSAFVQLQEISQKRSREFRRLSDESC